MAGTNRTEDGAADQIRVVTSDTDYTKEAGWPCEAAERRENQGGAGKGRSGQVEDHAALRKHQASRVVEEGTRAPDWSSRHGWESPGRLPPRRKHRHVWWPYGVLLVGDLVGYPHWSPQVQRYHGVGSGLRQQQVGVVVGRRSCGGAAAVHKGVAKHKVDGGESQRHGNDEGRKGQEEGAAQLQKLPRARQKALGCAGERGQGCARGRVWASRMP